MEQTDSHKNNAIMSLGIKMSNSDVDAVLIDRILAGLSLSQIKKEFIVYLISEGYIPNAASVGHPEYDKVSWSDSKTDKADDDIELF